MIQIPTHVYVTNISAGKGPRTTLYRSSQNSHAISKTAATFNGQTGNPRTTRRAKAATGRPVTFIVR